MFNSLGPKLLIIHKTRGQNLAITKNKFLHQCMLVFCVCSRVKCNALMDVNTCMKRSERCFYFVWSTTQAWAWCQAALFVVRALLDVRSTIVDTTWNTTAISSQLSYWRMSKLSKGRLDSAKSLTHCKAQKACIRIPKYTECAWTFSRERCTVVSTVKGGT